MAGGTVLTGDVRPKENPAWSSTELTLSMKGSYQRWQCLLYDIATSLYAQALRERRKIESVTNTQVASTFDRQRVIDHGEVFTPPGLVRDMLDLPGVTDECTRIDARLLEPACGDGNFLVEVLRRRLDAVSKKHPKHALIPWERDALCGLANLYGIELLLDNVKLCGERLIAQFTDAYTTRFCGKARTAVIDAARHIVAVNIHLGDALATTTPGNRGRPLIFTQELNVKFDVIVGNPPYQLNDGGHGRSAGPVYHRFVQQAKKLEPRYLAMVIPARWYAGGKGLGEFRAEMLGDDRMRTLVDYLNSQEVIPGPDVAGGLCYFLWDREHSGNCKVINASSGERASTSRKLDEYPIFIRSGNALPIIEKVRENSRGSDSLSERVLPRKQFGLPTNYAPHGKGVACWFTQRIGLRYADPKDVADEHRVLNKWNLLVPKAPIAGQTDFSKPVRFYYDENTRVAKPGECSSESWLVLGAFATRSETESYKSYIFTKIVRFLLLQTVMSQDVTRRNFMFVPDMQDYKSEFTDEMLRRRWKIDDNEWAYIDSKVG